MTVFVNNEKKELQDQSTIEHLVNGLQIPSTKGMALAINQVVIPKSTWQEYILNENDKVTIIRATQGG